MSGDVTSQLRRAILAWLLPVMWLLAACAGSVGSPQPTITHRTPSATAVPSLQPTASATLLPDEPPPEGASAEFKTDFGRHSVPYSEIFSGGPPKDGIPA